MLTTFAFTFGAKGLFLLIAAIAFGVLVVVEAVSGSRDWRNVLRDAAWTLALIAAFLWASGD